jgi:hypothetical protein
MRAGQAKCLARTGFPAMPIANGAKVNSVRCRTVMVCKHAYSASTDAIAFLRFVGDRQKLGAFHLMKEYQDG